MVTKINDLSLADLPDAIRGHKIALLCEGSAERVIAETLLNAGLFPFDSENVIQDNATLRPTIPRMPANKFVERYLQYDYGLVPTVIRIIDSTNERFRLGKAYDQIPVITVTTRPEIERLVIIRENKEHEYHSSHHLKPSDYCKKVLHFSCVKQESWLRDYWNDAKILDDVIHRYAQIEERRPSELFLADLLDIPKKS